MSSKTTRTEGGDSNAISGIGRANCAVRYVVAHTTAFSAINPHVISVLTETQALVDEPSIFEDLGFIAPEGSFLGEPCIAVNFAVDSTAEIMGTQVGHCSRQS